MAKKGKENLDVNQLAKRMIDIVIQKSEEDTKQIGKEQSAPKNPVRKK